MLQKPTKIKNLGLVPCNGCGFIFTNDLDDVANKLVFKPYHEDKLLSEVLAFNLTQFKLQYLEFCKSNILNNIPITKPYMSFTFSINVVEKENHLYYEIMFGTYLYILALGLYYRTAKFSSSILLPTNKDGDHQDVIIGIKNNNTDAEYYQLSCIDKEKVLEGTLFNQITLEQTKLETNPLLLDNGYEVEFMKNGMIKTLTKDGENIDINKAIAQGLTSYSDIIKCLEKESKEQRGDIIF